MLSFRDGLMRLVTTGADLTPRQLAVLLVAHEAGDESATTGALAKALKLPKPVISRAMDRLGSAGLMLRKRHPTDLRLVLAIPTAAGRKFAERLAA